MHLSESEETICLKSTEKETPVFAHTVDETNRVVNYIHSMALGDFKHFFLPSGL
jgi:hypothetical protein